MREKLVIDSHLKGVVGLGNVEETAIDDEGVLVSWSVVTALLDLVKDLAVDGQFRFSRDYRIVQEEVVASFGD